MPGITINTLDPVTGLNSNQQGLDFKIKKATGISINPLPQDSQHQVNLSSNLVPLNDSLPNYEKSIGNTVWLTDEGPDQLDDYRAINTPWYKNFGNGLASRTLSIIPKIGQTVGAMAGLTKYTADLLGVTGDEHNFETVYNNSISKAMSDMDQSLRDEFPVYATNYYNSNDFFKKISTQKFWFDDAFNGLAFLGSAWATGGATIGGLTKLGLSRGMAMGLGTLANTVGESAMEAKDTYDSIVQQLTDLKDADGNPLYTPEEVKQKAATGALNTFGANMLLLGPSNLWETKILFGSASNPFLTTARKIFNGELQSAEVQSLKHAMAEGIVKEGLWEEGLQTAVQQWEQRRAKGEVNNSGLYGGYIEQWFKDWSNIDGQTSMLLGAVIGLGGGAYGAYKENRENKEQFKEASSFVDNWKQQLAVAENTFVDNNKRLYKRDVQGNLILTRGEDQQRHGNTIPTYDPVFDTEGMTKRVLQLQYDNEAIQQSINAIINNDEIAQSVARHDILSRKVYAYLSNPLFESSAQAIEAFNKDTKEQVDKIAANETDPNEKAILYKGYTDSLLIAKQVQDKWDNITKSIGSQEDLLGDDIQKEFNNKIKKSILVNEVKKMALSPFQVSETGMNEDISKMLKEADDTIKRFSDKKSRKELFNQYKEESLNVESINKDITELEAKRTKDGTLSEQEQDKLNELKYKANLSDYIEGQSYLNRIGDNSVRGILLSDNSIVNQNIDRIGAKNTYYMKRGIDERDYQNSINEIRDLLDNSKNDVSSLIDAAKYLSYLSRSLEDNNNSNISKERYDKLLQLHSQIKDEIYNHTNQIQSTIDSNSDLLYDMDPITGQMINNPDISEEDRNNIEEANEDLEFSKSTLSDIHTFLNQLSIFTEDKNKLIDQNKLFTQFQEAKAAGKLNEFLEKEYITRNYITSPLEFIRIFELNPDNFDNIEELNNYLSDLNYIKKFVAYRDWDTYLS